MEDIYFEGDVDKWVVVVNILKVRYLLNFRDYVGVYNVVLNGINDGGGFMKYILRGSFDIVEGDKNLFWIILEGFCVGDIGNKNSYLL